MDANEGLNLHHCWCGIEHAIPVNLDNIAKETGQAIYCPLGHTWVYKETEAEKLRRQVGGLRGELSEANAENQRLERRVRRLEKKPRPKKRGKHDKKTSD